jgi:hypothetical protein
MFSQHKIPNFSSPTNAYIALQCSMAALRGVPESNNEQFAKGPHLWPSRSAWLKTAKSDRLLARGRLNFHSFRIAP